MPDVKGSEPSEAPTTPKKPTPSPAEPAKPAEAPAKPPADAGKSPKKRAPGKASPPHEAPKSTETKAPIRRRSDAGAAKPAPPRAAPKTPIAPRPAKVAPNATVVDASGLILGRAASLIAQKLLRGESIVVVHAERSVLTGERSRVLDFYIANRARGSKRSGPHYPRYPDRIFRRTVRGMLPHLKTRGKIAFDRLEVHIGNPHGLEAARPPWIDAAAARPAVRPPITLGEVSRLLGARL